MERADRARSVTGPTRIEEFENDGTRISIISKHIKQSAKTSLIPFAPNQESRSGHIGWALGLTGDLGTAII